jgi:ubiquinone/menaquinone biosynthesis C-methylase UbiE
VSFLIPSRSPSRERLDDPNLALDEMERSLRDIDNVNRRWGTAKVIARHLIPLMRGSRKAAFTLVDVGAGSGAASAALQGHLARAGLIVRMISVDLQWRHLAAGRHGLRNGAAQAVAADAFRLPFPARAADWTVATLFFHHFSPEENVCLLREFARVSRFGFALVDIRRHLFPLLFVNLAGRLAFESETSIHDGPASVRQAYTRAEAAQISDRAVAGSQVRRIFPYRLLIWGPADGESPPRPGC